MDLDQVVANVEELESRRQAGILTAAEYETQALALWEGWLHSAEPEAAVLQEVLAAVQRPGYHDAIHEIWSRWLRRVRFEEGLS